MRIGVPKEIKDQEYRVGMTPGSVQELTSRGHKIFVQQKAGAGIGFFDETYRLAGAEIVETAEEVYALADMIVKVKEPQPEECKRLKEGQLIFGYLHLAPDPLQAELLLSSGCVAIAYETVTDERGGLPLLTPASEVAGRLSIQAGAYCLEKPQGGRGVLLGGVPGVPPAKVVIIGGGVSGTEALKVALGMGANVTLFDVSLRRLRELDNFFSGRGRLTTCYSQVQMIAEAVANADLVVGAVLIPGAVAPKLVTREMLRKMHPGSVIVDLSIDQGGCFETSRPTTHSNPTYVEEGVVHYCVTNMPGGVPHTSTIALNNATLPFIIALAERGYRAACLENIHLRQGLNICNGKVTHQIVAEALQRPYTPAEVALSALH
jgi:alanine dehydrogenase